MVWQQKKKLRFCKVNSYRCLITSYFEILFQYVINFMHINMAMRKEEDARDIKAKSDQSGKMTENVSYKQ